MSKPDYEPYYRKSIALIVGIDSYSHSRLATLGEAENDARAMATLLGSPSFGFEIKLLLGQRATKRAILNALYACRATSQDERVFVYFACHGYTKEDNFGAEKGYVATFDTRPDREFTALSLNEITELRYYAGAKHIAFVFDTCFSGQALGLTRVANAGTDKLLTRRAYQVISAGAGDQPVSDFRSMTNLMIAGINSGEAAETGFVTINSLGFYLQRTMAFDTNKTQIPQVGHLHGSQGGDFILSIGNNQQIVALTPQNVLARPQAKTSQKFPQRGIHTAEVDLIGRLDNIMQPTVLSVSAGLSVSLWISGADKIEAIQEIQKLKPAWSLKRIRVLIYTDLLYLLLKDHLHKLDFVTIDSEYRGYEPLIKGRIMTLFTKYERRVSKTRIRFDRIDKSSPARVMASRVFRGEALPDQRISAKELLSLPV